MFRLINKLAFSVLLFTLGAYTNAMDYMNDEIKNSLSKTTYLSNNNLSNSSINNDFQTVTYTNKCRDNNNYNNHVLLTRIDMQKVVGNGLRSKPYVIKRGVSA